MIQLKIPGPPRRKEERNTNTEGEIEISTLRGKTRECKETHSQAPRRPATGNPVGGKPAGE